MCADINRTLTTHSKPLYQWINANRMVLNGDKTECMLLGTRQKLQRATPNFCVYGNNSIVKPVQVHKLLGLYVDSNLTWNIAPGYLTDLFVLNNSVHNHHSHVKEYNLSLGQRTFAYRGAKLWDTIPECIKNVNSVDTFKTHCLKFLVKDVYNCMHFPIDTLE